MLRQSYPYLRQKRKKFKQKRENMNEETGKLAQKKPLRESKFSFDT